MTRMTKRDLTDKQLLCIDLLIKKDVTVAGRNRLKTHFKHCPHEHLKASKRNSDAQLSIKPSESFSF